MKAVLRITSWILFALAALWLAFGIYYVLTVPVIAAGGAVLTVTFILALFALPAYATRRLARR